MLPSRPCTEVLSLEAYPYEPAQFRKPIILIPPKRTPKLLEAKSQTLHRTIFKTSRSPPKVMAEKISHKDMP